MGSARLWTVVPGAPDFLLNCINLVSSIPPCVEETTDRLSQIILRISNYMTIFFFLVPIYIFFRRLIPMGTPKTDDPKHLFTKIKLFSPLPPLLCKIPASNNYSLFLPFKPQSKRYLSFLSSRRLTSFLFL